MWISKENAVIKCHLQAFWWKTRRKSQMGKMNNEISEPMTSAPILASVITVKCVMNTKQLTLPAGLMTHQVSVSISSRIIPATYL